METCNVELDMWYY